MCEMYHNPYNLFRDDIGFACQMLNRWWFNLFFNQGRSDLVLNSNNYLPWLVFVNKKNGVLVSQESAESDKSCDFWACRSFNKWSNKENI